MTTSANRQAVRIARRELKRRGCTCHPRVGPVPDGIPKPPGSLAGHLVQHRLGCPVGDPSIALNALGILPVYDYYSHKGCER